MVILAMPLYSSKRISSKSLIFFHSLFDMILRCLGLRGIGFGGNWGQIINELKVF